MNEKDIMLSLVDNPDVKEIFIRRSAKYLYISAVIKPSDNPFELIGQKNIHTLNKKNNHIRVIWRFLLEAKQ